MAKDRSAGSEHHNGAIRDRSEVQSPANGAWVKRDTNSGRFTEQKQDSSSFKGARREILFPTEPSTIGRKKIDRAVERVVSRKK